MGCRGTIPLSCESGNKLIGLSSVVMMKTELYRSHGPSKTERRSFTGSLQWSFLPGDKLNFL